MAHPVSAPLPGAQQKADDSEPAGPTLRAALVGLGLLVLVLAVVAAGLVAYVGAGGTKTEAAEAAAPSATADHASMAAESAPASPFTSFAGQTAPNADRLAAAHVPYDAAMPAIPAGDVVHVNLPIRDAVVEIAPGVKYHTWTFGGSAPGPVIHVRQGQTVSVTLRNDGMMPHSIDFHAARIAPNVAFRDIAPGGSLDFRFEADDPGVFMYHCGTKPVLAHIANGMYGAIVVEPKESLPKADREYVLVSSEWYLGSNGVDAPAGLDMAKARAMLPDWVTWNGYAGQYKDHPLSASPGETVRFWVVAAGPSLRTDFHVVGTLLDRAWVDADLVDAPQHGVQTATVPAGGGGVFDVKIDEPGLYPFVSHSFASVDLGEVGVLKVGDVEGTMSH